MCTSANSFIGNVSTPTKMHRVVLTDIAESYTSGDVIGTLKQLNCAVMTAGGAARLVLVRVYEDSPAGTQVKAPLRLHFFRQTYTPPAQGSPFKGYITPTEYLGHVDVASGDYIEVGDGIGTDPDWAYAEVIPDGGGKVLRAESASSQLWMLAEVRDDVVFAGTATLTIELETILH